MSEQSERLLKVILDSELTYMELEKKTGIAKSSIQRYATGNTKKIPIDAVKAIADATNSSASWIMGWEEPQKETCATRLAKALSFSGMKQTDLSRITNIPKSSISQYMSGYSKPNAERVYLISKALNVSEAWLMGVDVPMERQEEPQNGARFPSVSPNTTEDYITFPLFEEFAKGPRCFSEEPCENQKIDIPLSYLKGRKKEDYFVLTVKGSNMYPLYHENDKVLILKQNTLKASGDIGVVCYDDIYVLLRKIEYTDGGNWLRLVSINPNFPPETITGDYRILGIPRLIIREINY